MNKNSNHGFTLVELAIVLVIIGLFVGGVLAGQELIKQSQLRAFIGEKNSLVQAINTFKLKYGALPGDLKKAYQFFKDPCDADEINSGNCNESQVGDGVISLYEQTKVWRHLSEAGLIEGNFSCMNKDGKLSTSINECNTKKSKIFKGYWNFTSYSNNAPGVFRIGSLFLEFGGSPNSDQVGRSSTLTNGDAYNLDLKDDDGRANTGNMRGDNGEDCVDDGSDYYSILKNGQNKKNWCVLHFIMN